MRYLGQHFLIQKNIVKKIADVAEISKNDTVLEVGPGKGILTEELLNRAKKVIAVEKDKRLCEFLIHNFNDRWNFVLICEDILRISNFKFLISNKILNPKFQVLKKIKNQDDNAKLKIYNNAKILPWQDFCGAFLETKKYKIVANIPYYITSRFLKIFLEDAKIQPQKMVLMVQKEVAERICEIPPASILAVSVQAYGAPKIAFRVSAGNFSPPPKVDSAVLIIDNISKIWFDDIREKDFFKVVKAGFSKKRKFLINNLSEGLKMPKLEIEKSFKECEVSVKARAEELSLDSWKCLVKNLKCKKRFKFLF